MRQAPQPTKELLSHFDGLHVAHLGERAVIQGGKDAKLIAALSASHGPERVKELMGLFFEVGRDDDFISNAGFSIGVFVSQCAKLIARQRLHTAKPRMDDDWWEDCQARHAGQCNGRLAHASQVQRDKIRAVS